MRIDWRASLVPAPAVITAPLAYIKIDVAKKARSWISTEDDWSALWLGLDIFLANATAPDGVVRYQGRLLLRK